MLLEQLQVVFVPYIALQLHFCLWLKLARLVDVVRPVLNGGVLSTTFLLESPQLQFIIRDQIQVNPGSNIPWAINWIILTLLIVNEKFTLLPISEILKYIAAFGLIALHVYNLKFCNCNDESCYIPQHDQ